MGGYYANVMASLGFENMHHSKKLDVWIKL